MATFRRTHTRGSLRPTHSSAIIHDTIYWLILNTVILSLSTVANALALIFLQRRLCHSINVLDVMVMSLYIAFYVFIYGMFSPRCCIILSLTAIIFIH
jgi:hypothetical protein